MPSKSAGNEPRISLVLEWENATALERSQALGFLRGLSAHVAGFARQAGGDFEFLVVFDPRTTPDEELARDLAEALPTADRPGRLTLLAVPGAPYYAKKGLAAHFAAGDIVAYCDSDCRYAPGWLEALLAPIVNGEADVTCGATFADVGPTLVERASALAWFFPLDDAADPLARETGRFFANNFAARKATLIAVPLPRHHGSRSHGGLWLRQLRHAGARVAWVDGAKAFHRQYDSVGHLMRRAWVLGRDGAISAEILAQRRGKRLRRQELEQEAPAARKPREYRMPRFTLLGRAFLATGSSLALYGRRMTSPAARRILTARRWMAALTIGAAFQATAATSRLWHALTEEPARVRRSYRGLQAKARISQLGED